MHLPVFPERRRPRRLAAAVTVHVAVNADEATLTVRDSTAPPKD